MSIARFARGVLNSVNRRLSHSSGPDVRRHLLISLIKTHQTTPASSLLWSRTPTGWFLLAAVSCELLAASAWEVTGVALFVFVHQTP